MPHKSVWPTAFAAAQLINKLQENAENQKFTYEKMEHKMIVERYAHQLHECECVCVWVCLFVFDIGYTRPHPSLLICNP